MKKWGIVCLFLLGLFAVEPVFSQQTRLPIPTIGVNVEEARTPRQVALSLQILFLITIISLAPTLLIVLTSYIRLYIVLSFVSRGLATQTIPPNQVIVSLALFITLFVMFPTFSKSYEEGVRPYLDGKISLEEGYKRAIKPVREFMFKQTSERYIYRFVKMSKMERPRTPDDVPTYVLIPAFILNELTISFYMGMLILIPFTIIDIVVASVLMSMGMMMLPPIMISFPLKLLLFLLVDGWDLLIEKLILSFRM
ncbi:MAG: flagellar type III secretion system pore protein FliP [Brevinematales bacterium]|nr:flagellar type III secretion system pore protein FliP [Brevinematales bacterium]